MTRRIAQQSDMRGKLHWMGTIDGRTAILLVTDGVAIIWSIIGEEGGWVELVRCDSVDEAKKWIDEKKRVATECNS